MQLTQDACYRAVQARDRRYDGWFFGGVLTTGIYCRPSCPARTPLRRNMRFYPTAAAAQQAGFRACRRCRPDSVPGSPAYDHAGDVAARAVRLVDDGYVERHGVDGLAARLGYSTRQLNRILHAELGAGPLQLARARRTHTARVLVQTTDLAFADIAFAAGFGSIRQFDDTLQAVFARTPSQLRAGRPRPARRPSAASVEVDLELRLAYREPFDATHLWAFLRARAVPGLEEFAGATYRRVLRLPHGPGIVALTPADGHVGARLRLSDLRDLSAAVTRCRRLLDLDADPVSRAALLAGDPTLTDLVRRYPGLRVPGSVDPFETAVRAVLGQQVSLSAAARLAEVLVGRAGQPVADPGGRLTHAFPAPATVVADLAAQRLPMPAARTATLAGLSAAVASGRLALDHAADVAATAETLRELPGIGPWTRDYIRLRALGDLDAFPAGDLALRREAAVLGAPADARALERWAARWCPARGLAAQLLWTSHAERAQPHPSLPSPCSEVAS